MAGDHRDDEECPFCMGREAAHAGEPATANPFAPTTDAAPPTPAWYESPHGLWDFGHSLGEGESGRSHPPEESMAGYERRQRTVVLPAGSNPPAEVMAAVRRDDPAATRVQIARRVNYSDTSGADHEWSVTYWATTD